MKQVIFCSIYRYHLDNRHTGLGQPHYQNENIMPHFQNENVIQHGELNKVLYNSVYTQYIPALYKKRKTEDRPIPPSSTSSVVKNITRLKTTNITEGMPRDKEKTDVAAGSNDKESSVKRPVKNPKEMETGNKTYDQQVVQKIIDRSHAIVKKYVDKSRLKSLKKGAATLCNTSNPNVYNLDAISRNLFTPSSSTLSTSQSNKSSKTSSTMSESFNSSGSLRGKSYPLRTGRSSPAVLNRSSSSKSSTAISSVASKASSSSNTTVMTNASSSLTTANKSLITTTTTESVKSTAATKSAIVATPKMQTLCAKIQLLLDQTTPLRIELSDIQMNNVNECAHTTQNVPGNFETTVSIAKVR